MTRDELKEKVAVALMNRFIKPDMHEPATLADGSKQWRVDHFGEMAEAALSAIEGEDEADFELHQDDTFAAGACGPKADAAREILHYALMYGQDGPVQIVQVLRIPVEPERLRAMDGRRLILI